MKYPYIKFYVRDWISDAQLRMVSLAARGLWIECLCIMQMAIRRGFLETSTGVAINDEMLARLTGTFKGDLYTLKEELLNNGVPSVEEETGIWYCRRMVNEERKSEKCSDAGKRGGGNPALINKEVIHIPDTRNHISIKGTFKGQSKGQSEDSPEFIEFWTAYPKKKSKGHAKKAFEKSIKITTLKVILESIKKLSQSDDWLKDGGKYIPHPSTWLNAQGWEDEVKSYTKDTTSSNTSFANQKPASFFKSKERIDYGF